MQCQATFGGSIYQWSFPSSLLDADFLLGRKGKKVWPCRCDSQVPPSPMATGLTYFFLVVYVTPLQTAIPNSTCLKPCWINLLWIPQNKKLRSLLAYHCESIKHSVILLFVPAVTTPHPSSHFCWLCQHICRRKKEAQQQGCHSYHFLDSLTLPSRLAETAHYLVWSITKNSRKMQITMHNSVV